MNLDIILVFIAVMARTISMGMLLTMVIPKQIREAKVLNGLGTVRKGLLIGTVLYCFEISMLWLMGGMYLFNPKPVHVTFLLYAFVFTSIGDLITSTLLYIIYNIPQNYHHLNKKSMIENVKDKYRLKNK